HDVDDSRQKGDAIYVGFTVLSGTVPGQINKQFTERFADPSPSQKDGGKFCRKRQGKLLLATGVLTAEKMRGPTVTIDWQDCLWKQIKGAVKNYERKSDEGKVFRGA